MAPRRSPFRPWSRRCASASCFMPLFLLGGVARYLFVPLAEAVVFAMLASYILSRTLVPTLAMYLLSSMSIAGSRRIRSCGFSRDSSVASNGCATAYRRVSDAMCSKPRGLHSGVSGVCLCAFLLVPWLGQDFFPQSDSGQFILHLRANTGTRIEETRASAIWWRTRSAQRFRRRDGHHSRQHRPAVQPV